MIKDTLQHNENINPGQKQLVVLREHFPACFKQDGSFDLERFKEEIAGKTNVIQEGYELKFLGKSYARLLASTDTTTVIQPDVAHNSLPENAKSENIYISGDNLDGLKHLLKSYNGQIKCIYIDPPYNTGSDEFVYRDNFNYTKETLQEKLSISEEEAERILDLTKRGSASHSAWLMFMYCRLLLARDLLKDEGVIFISVDDNEQANLKLLCDDVFGEENFVGCFCWRKKAGAGADSKLFFRQHENILFYSKNSSSIPALFQPLTEKQKSEYKNPDNDIRGEWAPTDLKRADDNDPKRIYKVVSPTGWEFEACWSYTKANFKKLEEDNLIWWGKDGSTEPKRKRFLKDKEGLTPRSWIDNFLTSDGAKDLKSLELERIFNHPKPIGLIKHFIQIGTDKNSLIVDFFSGSATTSHAVMQLNAEDGGNRKFIAVQLPETLSAEDASKKAAYEFLKQNNLPTTLDYIGIERIKRAAAKIKQEHPGKELDLGFKHYALAEPNQNTLDKLDSFDKAGMLADTTILDDFGKPTILTTWLNADGYGLTAQAQAIDLAGYTAYHYDKHLYLVDGGFSLDSMKALIQKYDTEGSFNPENLVLFGYSFPDWSISEMIEKNLRILNDSEKNLKINYSVRY